MSRTDDGSSVAKRAQTLGRRCLSGEVVGEDREPVIVKAGRMRDRLEAFKAAPESEFARVFANLPEAPALEGSERVSPLIGKLDMPTLTARPRQRASLSPATRPWPPIPCGRLDAAGRFNPPSGWPITRGRRGQARPCPVPIPAASQAPPPRPPPGVRQLLVGTAPAAARAPLPQRRRVRPGDRQQAGGLRRADDWRARHLLAAVGGAGAAGTCGRVIPAARPSGVLMRVVLGRRSAASDPHADQSNSICAADDRRAEDRPRRRRRPRDGHATPYESGGRATRPHASALLAPSRTRPTVVSGRRRSPRCQSPSPRYRAARLRPGRTDPRWHL